MWEVVIVVGGTNQWDATSCLVVMRAIRNVQWAGDSVCVCVGGVEGLPFYFILPSRL